MIGLIQRVSSASVDVAGERIAEIGPGMLVLVGVTRGDTEQNVDKLAHRLFGYRLFEDDAGKMNLSLKEIAGGLLLVPQFTLAADTKKGMRAGFSRGAPPDRAKELFDLLANRMKEQHAGQFGTGRFGTDMAVSLVNDGPVTFWIEI